MLINTQGKIWKPKNMLNSIVNYADTVGENYIAKLEHIEKDTLISDGYVLVDKKCNPLSKIYGDMYYGNHESSILVDDKDTNNTGFIDLQGNELIPPIYNTFYDDNPKNNFIVLKLNNKFGVLDIEGKSILPFIYHKIREINDDFFAVQGYDSLCNEYVVNSKQEILTKAVFCHIDSFANSKVWQNWGGKHHLVYNVDGKCLSSKKHQNQKGLLKLFFKDIKTKAIYSGNPYLASSHFYMPRTTDEVEIVLVSPNQYRYEIVVGYVCMRRCRNKIELPNKIDFTIHNVIKNFPVVIEIKRLLMVNTKTKKEKTINKFSVWYFFFNNK